jgi:predicted Zn finger-like uncharacterized protein
MIISCPNCSTRFTISDTALPADGRTVRCSKCGTKWHQDPPVAEPAASPAPAAPKEPEPEPSPPAESAPSEEPPPAEEKPEAPAGEEEPDLSDIDVTSEEKPAEAEAETPAVPDLKAERETEEAVRPKVPKKPVEEEKTAPSGLMIGWIALAVLVVAVIGITFGFKDSIVSGWPATARFYNAIGLHTELPAPKTATAEPPKAVPAEKPQFQTESVTTSTETVDGVDYRVVNGMVRNTGKTAAPVPEIRTRLSGEDHKVLSETVHKLDGRTLQPNETEAFTVKIANPPADARYLEVDTVSGD